MPRKPRIAVMMDLDKPHKNHVVVFAGIHRYAQEAHWQLITDDWADRSLPARAGAAAPFEGMIGRITKLGAHRAARLGLPVVNVHFNSPAANLPGVFPDYAAAGRLRAEHLLSRGFWNFGTLIHAGDRTSIIEGDAFAEAVNESGGRMCGAVILHSGRPTRMGLGETDLADYQLWRQAIREIDRWMDQWQLPIGLMIHEVAIARLVIERCRQRGWRVPEDVALVAGYNEESQCVKPEPSITSMEFPDEMVGYEAARLLDQCMQQRQRIKSLQEWKQHTRSASRRILLPPVGIVARQSTDFHAVEDKLVRKALGFIDTHLDEPIHIEDIAEHVGVSRATLMNRFRDKLGRTIGKEMQRLRVERIKRELVTSDKPIYSIALDAGFSSVRTLNDLFRKVAGCTPREYRKGGAAIGHT